MAKRGYLQRMAAAGPVDFAGVAASSGDHQNVSSDRNCPLSLLLITLVLWGGISAALSQRIAHAAVQSGASSPVLKSMANSGAGGSWSKNVWRDMRRRFESTPMSRALSRVRLPFKGQSDRTYYVQAGMALPHVVFATLYQHYHTYFLEWMCAGVTTNITAFWDCMQDHPAMVDHPMKTRSGPSYKTHGVPLVLHCDGTAVTGVGKAWGKVADCISFSSCLSKGVKNIGRLASFIVIMISEFLLQTIDDVKVTEEAIWKEVVWSLYWLRLGVWPDRGSDNVLYTTGEDFIRRLTPLADGYFGELFVEAADLDWNWKKFKMANPQASHSCSSCRANNTDPRWTDVRDDATWIDTIHTNASYRLHHPNLHRLFRHLPGFGITNYIPDTLHCKCLGSDQSFLASVMRYLTHHTGGPSTPDQKLTLLLTEMKVEYKRMKTTTRYNKITHNMIHPPSKQLPQLKGKAAEIKDLVPVIAVILRRRMDPNNEQERDMVDGLDASARIDQTLKDYKSYYRFPPDVAERFRQDCFQFAQCQNALIHHYHPDVPLFNVTPKTHYVLHLGLIAKYINPGLGSCWAGEDLMRVARKLWQASCIGNVSGPQVQFKSMDKYMFAMSFEMRAI